jgi:hypothetical protein
MSRHGVAIHDVARADLILSTFGRGAKSIFTLRLHLRTSAVHATMQTSAPQRQPKERPQSVLLAAVNPVPDHLTALSFRTDEQ